MQAKELQTSYLENGKALAEFIKTLPDSERGEILENILNLGIDANEPLFLPLLVISQTSNLVEKVQELLKETPETCAELAQNLIADATSAIEEEVESAVNSQEQLILESALRVYDTVDKRFFFSARGLCLSGGIAVFLISIGIFVGLFLPVWWQGGFSQGKITQRDRETLTWANSAEGIIAKRISQLNSGYLSYCQQDALKKGLSLTYGSIENKNVCLLQIAPP